MASAAVRLRRSLSPSSRFSSQSTSVSLSSSIATTVGASFLLPHTPISPRPPNPIVLGLSLFSLSRFIRPYYTIHHRHFHLSSPSLASLNIGEEQVPDADAGLLEDFGCNDWVCIMKFTDDPRPSSQDMLDTYLLTLAKVVGSVEEAKKRMYYYCTEKYTAFYAKIGEDASKRLKGIPGVVSVLPNSYSFQATKEDKGLTQAVERESESGNLLEKSGAEQDLLSLSDLETEVQGENDSEQQRGPEFSDLKRNVENKQQSADTEASEEAVEILEDDVQDEVKFWKTSLIGYVLGERVSHGKMAKYVESKWNMVTPPQIIAHRRGFFIFRFQTEEDRKSVLKSRNRSFYSKLFMLIPWDPDVDIDKVSTDQFTSWVRFPDLKLQFWGDKVLKKIASKVGVPIRIDRLTAEKKLLSYARFLIGVDLSKEPVKEVTLKCPNGQIVRQKVVYELLPHRCRYCNAWVLVEHKCPLGWKKNLGSKKAEQLDVVQS